MDRTKPAISIIVTSYTMERFNDLTELLAGIHSQTYRNFETLVVIENSTQLYDKLKTYVKEKGYSNTRVLFNLGPRGLSQARNLGIKKARGEIITFIDDDALPFPEWLEEIVKTFAGEDSVIGITGFAFPLWEDESLKWFPEEFYWIIGCSAWCELIKMKEVRNAWGANMSFAEEAFTPNRLFNEEDFGSSVAYKKGVQGLMGDDTEFSLRLKRETGKRIIYNPKVNIWHKVYSYKLSSEFIRHFAYRHAYSKAVIRQVYHASQGEDVLAREHELLRRILFRLLPSILVGFFTKPVVSYRRLAVTATVLFYSALGYFMAAFHRGNGLEIRQP